MNMTNAASQVLLPSDMHWAAGYIGTPWANGAQGPDSFDCWSFFRHIQIKHFGIDVPIIEVDADNWRSVIKGFVGHDERSQWIATIRPKEGDAVLMRHSKYPSHVGLWLDVDGGGVLHCVRGEGVIFSSLTALKLSGWGKLEFYTHASHA